MANNHDECGNLSGAFILLNSVESCAKWEPIRGDQGVASRVSELKTF